MESMQCNAVPAIAGPIRSASRENLYQELRLESLCKRQWYFFKISKGQSLDYLLLPSVSKAYKTRTNSNIPHFSVKLILYNFFPWTVIEWNDLDLNIRNSETFSAFKKSILKFIRPRIKLGLSHLRTNLGKIFRIFNSICHRDYYLLPINCPNYLDERATILDKVQIIGENICNKNDFDDSQLLLLAFLK